MNVLRVYKFELNIFQLSFYIPVNTHISKSISLSRRLPDESGFVARYALVENITTGVKEVRQLVVE